MGSNVELGVEDGVKTTTGGTTRSDIATEDVADPSCWAIERNAKAQTLRLELRQVSQEF